ncbi:MAG: response regulator [Anaerolineae bacterium]|nr:response regulator [Anaerolineae bacterium]
MMRILIIEDEAILRGEVIEWLTLEGYETRGAADGIEGINAAFQHTPDLLICDITMPRLDGYGVLLELRANPATANTPFIFVTARAAQEDIRKGMNLGADDYLTKPFSRLELLHAVESRLEKKSIQEQRIQLEVSEWQQAFKQEREQRLLKAKLVAMFSHDFRNPLASIMSSNSLLRNYADRMDEAHRLAHMDRIDASVRQLLQMLDDMLIVSQMETGSLDFKPEQLSPVELLQDIVNEFAIIHGESHQLVCHNRFDGLVAADPRLMRQIAANLISNAIKYSPQGSEIEVVLERHDRLLVLTVQDHGIGIPEADQSRLFEAFERASNVGSVSGTGLGLAIVKQAVDLHSGTIQLESQVNIGTTVTVNIPI